MTNWSQQPPKISSLMGHGILQILYAFMLLLIINNLQLHYGDELLI